MTGPRDVLIATLEDVNAANTPEELRVIAFSKVFDLRSGGSSITAGSPAGETLSRGGGGGSPSGNSGDALAAIAAKVDLDRETVAEVFDERGGDLELVIAAGKLPSQVAAGAKAIALLIAGGRQAAGVEEWTSLDAVREVCAEFKKLDSGNFSKTIRSMTDEFNVRKESERKTVVRVSRPGWESFGTLVQRLAGAS